MSGDSTMPDQDRVEESQLLDDIDDYGSGVSGAVFDEETVRETIKDSRPYWLLAVPLLLLLVAGTLIFLSIGDATDEPTEAGPGTTAELQSEIADGEVEDGAENGTDGATETAGAEADAEPAEGETDDGEGGQAIEVETAQSQVPEPPTDQPYVDATLTDNIFVLSGVVPDEATKQALETRAEIAYSPFNSSELVVDESVGTASWLETAPNVVGLLPMITDGTIRLQEDAVTLVGRSPTENGVELFAGAVGALTGLPVDADGIALTNLSPPRFVAEVEDGKVALEGEIPNQQLLETFIAGAAAVYGPENVTSTMTVDEGTYTSFWNYTMPGVFQLLSPFPSYRLQVKDAVTSGQMQGAILFELNSAGISDQAEQLLPIGIALLSRDLSLDMTVIGHTDSQGPDDLNQRLSVERAQSVVDFFVANGIDESRLTAEGKGSSEPIADNETEGGRALNRRVEFRFG